MSRTLVICVVLVFCGAWPSLASDIEELVEAEHRFAEAAATDGMRDAFLAVLADDGVMFRPATRRAGVEASSCAGVEGG
jgi:hypothetical protein